MKKMWLFVLAFVLCLPGPLRAQDTPPSPANDVLGFQTWLSQQQAHAGFGWLVKNDKAKYVVTWWDLAQFGQSGINLAKPSLAHDYVDISPAWAVANARYARYGLAVPIHGGNIWNDVHFSANVESHINKTALPNFIIAYVFLLPKDVNVGTDLPLNKMRPWDRDGMITFTYGFGGS